MKKHHEEYKQFVYHFATIDSINVYGKSSEDIEKITDEIFRVEKSLSFREYNDHRKMDADTARKLLKEHFPECLI